MDYTVVRGTSYCLVHAPGLALVGGTTLVQERAHRSDSPLMQNLGDRLRSYEAARDYPPNQTYLGVLSPEELVKLPRPWYSGAGPGLRFGPFGEIMPEAEFYLLLKAADSFQVVHLEQGFLAEAASQLSHHPLLSHVGRKLSGAAVEEIEARVGAGGIPLHLFGRLVGVVNRAHEHDDALSAAVMLENLVAKASAWLAAVHLLATTGTDPTQIDYVLECSEEACGDMNQRGGGNFAKAIAEVCGCLRATGSDTRAFCAAPVHAIVSAAGLIQAGIYRNVLIVAGGSLAKLGMNARDHVAKGLPVLEDTLGAFALLLTPDDAVSPRIRTDLLGRLPVGAGSSPQAVMEALVVAPLDIAGLTLSDVDRYASELHNPEVTEPAGAGDIPRSNYRMIAALAARRGEIDRSDLNAFVAAHGVPGFVPTQGHIPSGIPYVGHACRLIRNGSLRRVMIIGKGSLFLGRMTNLFDGLSFILEANEPPAQEAEVEVVKARRKLRIAISVHDLERGSEEGLEAVRLAQHNYPDLEILAVGDLDQGGSIPVLRAGTPEQARRVLEQSLAAGRIDAGVVSHYAFPLGIATVARLKAPGTGRSFLLASTTGSTSADRVRALVTNAVLGRSVARALGTSDPSVALLNLDGAPAALRELRRLQAAGYPIRLVESARSHGGGLLRGNDLLVGGADVVVTDTLTGNALVKLMSAWSSGGLVETSGEGYGPGVGNGMKGMIHIVSRASSAGVIAAAAGFAEECIRGDLPARVAEELGALDRAEGGSTAEIEAFSRPLSSPLTSEVSGTDVLRLDESVDLLRRHGISAQPGMGCMGPVVLVGADDRTRATRLLAEAGFLEADRT